MKKDCSIFFTILLVVVVQACKTSFPNYGINTLKVKNDSMTIVNTKKEFNSFDTKDFGKNIFTSKDSIEIPYRLLQPIHKQDRKYPLVITFHNSSRLGSDNVKQLEPLARLWLQPKIRKKYQAYILAPQFATRSTIYSYDDKRKITVSSPQANLKDILDLIEKIRKEYPIDEGRIYLIGYSMGASSVIDLLNLKPGLFAAAVAIAPVPNFDKMEEIKQTPLWLMHGKDDVDNPFVGSEVFYKEASTQNKTRFWIFEKTTHNNIVSPTILGDKIPKWLFQNNKNLAIVGL